MQSVNELYLTFRQPNQVLTQFFYEPNTKFDDYEFDYAPNSYIDNVRNYAITKLNFVKKLLVDGIDEFFRAPGSFLDYFKTAFRALANGFMALVLVAISLIALALLTAAFTLSLFADWQMAGDLMVAMSSQATMAVMAIAVAVLGAIKPVVSIFTSARNIQIPKGNFSSISQNYNSSNGVSYQPMNADEEDYETKLKVDQDVDDVIESSFFSPNVLFSGKLGRAVTYAWADVADAIKPAATPR